MTFLYQQNTNTSCDKMYISLEELNNDTYSHKLDIFPHQHLRSFSSV